MKKFLCALFLLGLAFPLVSYDIEAVGAQEFELKLMSPAQIQVEPGKILTLSMAVINHSGLEQEFSEELDLPSDWQVIIPTTAFKLGAYHQEVRLLSVVIPATAAAGSYRIGYTITGHDGQKRMAQTAVDVEVLSISALESSVEEKPQVVMAGDEYRVQLRYLNRGNAQLELGFEVKSIPGYPVRCAPVEMVLEPGASQVLTITVQTDEALKQAVRHVINVKAIDKKTSIVVRRDTVITEVIPTVVGDGFHRIPTRTTMITGVEGKTGHEAVNVGFQLGFFGSGSIDEAGKHQLDLSFLTPNPFGRNFNQNTPNFNLRYRSTFFDLTAGNRNMSLSALTKRWSGYDNFKLDFHPAGHRIGLINPGKAETGFYYGYQFAAGLGIRANYLQGDKASTADGLNATSDLYSVQADIKPLANTTLNLEFATMEGRTDGKSDAYRFYLRGIGNNSFYYSIDQTYAGPDYYGTYHDLETTNGTLSFLLYNKLQTALTFHRYRNNLEFDPTEENARDERNYRANLAYYFNPQTALLLSIKDAQKKDRLVSAEYDHEERSIKFGFQHQFPRWRVQAYTGVGAYRDHLGGGQATNFKTHNLNLNYTPTARQTYFFFINTADEKDVQLAETNSAVGLKANLQLLEKLDLSLEYQKRHFLRTTAHDYLALDLTYHANRFALALKTSQLEADTYNNLRWSLLGSYQLPIEIPVSRRKEVGGIKGRVLSGEEAGATALPNIVVKVNGMTAITDEAGEFTLSAIPPGKYWVSIDHVQAGLDLTSIKKMPLVVEVKKGEIVELQIELVPTAKVRGKTVVNIPEQKQDGDYLVVASDRVLANTLIEFSNGEETFRQVTNSKGEFTFSQMRPGQWTLKAYDHSLPAHYYFEIAETPLELKPGETREFIFTALPQMRTIQIVEEGSIGPGGSVVSTRRLLNLDELFVVEYYASTTPSGSAWSSLQQAGHLRQNYLDYDRYFTDIVYIVKKGETLSGIADKFQVPLERLINLNYLGTSGSVQANAVLIIPIPVEFIHLVAEKETLETIAKKYGTTVELLIDLNSISGTDRLQSGQPLVLPGR